MNFMLTRPERKLGVRNRKIKFFANAFPADSYSTVREKASPVQLARSWWTPRMKSPESETINPDENHFSIERPPLMTYGATRLAVPTASGELGVLGTRVPETNGSGYEGFARKN